MAETLEKVPLVQARMNSVLVAFRELFRDIKSTTVGPRERDYQNMGVQGLLKLFDTNTSIY
eukprot:scaffold26915_cov71-Attheya_sp.AAC.10